MFMRVFIYIFIYCYGKGHTLVGELLKINSCCNYHGRDLGQVLKNETFQMNLSSGK